MDESDSDSNNGSEDDQSVTEEEQLRIAAAAVEEREQQLTSLLERKEELPLRTRKKFDELVAELLTKTKDDIHGMIFDDDDQGLDSSRDTEAQVETAIRFFPEVISQPTPVRSRWFGDDRMYPIQRLCSNNRINVSFIVLLVRLAIEFHSFEDHERGGLLIENDDGKTFRNLMWNCRRDQNDLLLTLLIRLRRMGLFKKEDIRDYDLVSSSCFQTDSAERGHRFLVEWDPTSLIRTNRHGFLPLHLAAENSIQNFTTVFGYGIRYYPFQKGLRLLFQLDDNDGDDTPFEYVCQKYGSDKVMEIVEEILIRYHSEGTPLNIVEALMVAAADENVLLDCSYFLLRREPDVLARLLSGPHNNTDDGGESDGDHNDVDNDKDHEEDDDNNNRDGVGSDGDGGDDDNDDGGDEGGVGTKKRKRRVWSIH